MNKSDLTGWKEVFSFSFAQTVKQKAYGVFLVIFSLIALFYSTGQTLIDQYNEHKESKVKISEVIVFDETGLKIDYTNVFTSKKYDQIKVNANPSKSQEAYEQEMEETPDDRMLIKVSIDEDEKSYHIIFIQGINVSLSEIAKVNFADEFCDFYETAAMDAINVSKEQQKLLQTSLSTEVKSLSETGEVIEKEKEGITYQEYLITLIMTMVSMMLINLSGNQIALSIVTEKSSRVLEYLVLNVRPLALITGKLLAAIVTSTLQMVAVGFCFLASPIVSNMITPRLLKWIFGDVVSKEASAELAEEMLASTLQMIHGIKMEFVLLAIFFMILGIIAYGIIAGLLGASVSKMDEMQEAMSMFALMLIFGCYAVMGLIIMQMMGKASPVFSKVLSLCPITSPFLVPCNMILGKISWPLAIASILMMLVVIVLLFKLTANVYEAMIFYNGKALKVKDILALASSKKKSQVKEGAKYEK